MNKISAKTNEKKTLWNKKIGEKKKGQELPTKFFSHNSNYLNSMFSDFFPFFFFFANFAIFLVHFFPVLKPIRKITPTPSKISTY